MAQQAYAMESITRPFTVIETAPFETITVAPETDLLALPPAQIAWGAASEFVVPDAQLSTPLVFDASDAGDYGSAAGYVNYLESGESLFDALPEVLEWEEVSRSVSIVRIYNPAESDLPPSERTQWLDVERIETVTFRMSDGQEVRLKLNHQKAPLSAAEIADRDAEAASAVEAMNSRLFIALDGEGA